MTEKISNLKSRRDEFDSKLINLRNATVAVGELLDFNFVAVPGFAMRNPDWKAIKLPLINLTKKHGFQCDELARILIPTIKLQTDSTVRDAENYLNAREMHRPSVLIKDAGLAAIHQAAEAGDTRFFIQLGDRLHNSQKLIKRRRPLMDYKKFTLWFYWQPNPQNNWPGLAYCKPTALWNFLEIHAPGIGRKPCINYLDNIRRRMGLIRSRQCFISEIKGVPGKLKFT